MCAQSGSTPQVASRPRGFSLSGKASDGGSAHGYEIAARASTPVAKAEQGPRKLFFRHERYQFHQCTPALGRGGKGGAVVPTLGVKTGFFEAADFT